MLPKTALPELPVLIVSTSVNGAAVHQKKAFFKPCRYGCDAFQNLDGGCYNILLAGTIASPASVSSNAPDTAVCFKKQAVLPSRGNAFDSAHD